MSWKPEVKVSGSWGRNGLVFGTKEEAEASACNLYSGWMLATDSRAVESDLPVNYRWESGEHIPVKA